MQKLLLALFMVLLASCAQVASGPIDGSDKGQGSDDDPIDYRALFTADNSEAKSECHSAGQFWVELRKGSDRHYLCVAGNEFLMTRLSQLGLYSGFTSCGGACSTFAFRLISGAVDDSDQSFLENDQRSNGYFLADVAYPTSDFIAERDVEDELY